jgi:hypothetical protein
MGNLESIAISFKVWALDHYDGFPFNVSTNAGGTMEFCARGADGFDRNAHMHIRALSNELGSGLSVLVCPEDRTTKPAASCDTLQAANLSYRFRSGTNVNESNAQEVLAICPIHRLRLLCTGETTRIEAARDSFWPAGVRNRWRYDAEFRRGAKRVAASLAAAIALVLLGTRLKHHKAVSQ